MENNSLENPIRKRGRPVGSGLGKESGFTHYNPKRWHPEFDIIVIESINGLSNTDIGEKYGYTPQHISNILSTTQAREIKERLRGVINKEAEEGIRDKIKTIGEKAVGHIAKFLEDENNLAERNPFHFIPIALSIAKSSSALGDGNGNGRNGINVNVNGNAAFVISDERAKDIRDAIENSSELDNVIPIDRRLNG